MRLRSGILGSLLVVALLAAFVPGPLATWRAQGWRALFGGAARPNVILISIDTLRADALGCYGAARPTSPELDRFAARAVRFERAIAPSGVTAPSHMSILTSLYPSVHRVGNDSFSGQDAPPGIDPAKVVRFKLDARVPTLASILCQSGFRTAAFVGGGNLNRELGFDQGFELFDDAPDNGFNGNRAELFEPRRALEWLDLHADEPRFLFLHTYIPHSPYLPPAPWNRAFLGDYQGALPIDREAFFGAHPENNAQRHRAFWQPLRKDDGADLAALRALYDGEVRYADLVLGQLLAEFERRGLFEDSIVIVLSDHGEGFGERGWFEHPGELYDEIVRVPWLMHLPREPFAGRVITEGVSTLDLLPTLLELLELASPPDLQGRSLVPLLARTAGEEPQVSEMITGWANVGAGQGVPIPSHTIRTIRDGPWSYVLRVRGKEVSEELYDRSTDTGERANLVSESRHAEVLRRLRERMVAHDASCRALARTFDNATLAELSPQTLRDLGALGYTDE